MVDAPWYGKPEYVALWVHILLKASHRDREVMMNNQVIKIKKGQFISGRKALSKETGISEQTVRTALKLFTRCSQLNQQTTNKYSVFTVLNWEKFQELTSKQPASNQHPTTDNNVNNVTSKEKGAVAPPAPAKPKFVKPTLVEVRAYCAEKKLNMDCDGFVDHFESNGWRVGGKTAMKCWRSAMRNWAKRDFGNKAKPQGAVNWG